MELTTNDKIAIALLDEVQSQVDEYFGNTIAMPMMPDGYDAKRDLFCEEMVKQCDLAEQKSSTPVVILRSTLLKAQCYGCWQKIVNSRGVHGNAKAHYEKALKLTTTNEQKAEIYYRYAIFARTSFMGSKQLATENFNNAINLAGQDSVLGIECAKELAKIEQKSGCFIATACYGTDTAPDVLTLRTFRDNVLLSSKTGRTFIKIYYLLSPPVAKVIESHYLLRSLVRQFFVKPLASLCSSRMKKGNHDDIKR